MQPNILLLQKCTWELKNSTCHDPQVVQDVEVGLWEVLLRLLDQSKHVQPWALCVEKELDTLHQYFGAQVVEGYFIVLGHSSSEDHVLPCQGQILKGLGSLCDQGQHLVPGRQRQKLEKFLGTLDAVEIEGLPARRLIYVQGVPEKTLL